MSPFILRPVHQLINLAHLRDNFEITTIKSRRDQPDLDSARETVWRDLKAALHKVLWPPLAAELREGLNEVFDMHELRQGDRPAGKTAASVEWDESLSEQSEAYLGDEVPRILGSGWVGELMIGPRLDEQAVRERIASDCARRLAEHLAETVTLEQIGLDQSDIDAVARLRLITKETAAPPQPAGDAAQAVNMLGEHLQTLSDFGRLPDEITIMEDLELIGDYDPVLTPGALDRLGIDAEFAPHAAAYRKAHGQDWPRKLLQAALAEPSRTVEAPERPPVVPEPEDTPAPAPEPRRGRPRKDAGRPAIRERMQNLQRGMFLIGAHGGTPGRDLAAHIGITQTQWSKVINGKADVDLGADQLERLVATAKSHIVGLEDAVVRLQKALME